MAESDSIQRPIEQVSYQEPSIGSLVRVPEEGYLERCLGLGNYPDPSLDYAKRDYYLSYTQTHNPDYLQNARNAIRYLSDNLEAAVYSPDSFRQLLEVYAYKSSYIFNTEYSASTPADFGDYDVRNVPVPLNLNTHLLQLAQRLREVEPAEVRNQPALSLTEDPFARSISIQRPKDLDYFTEILQQLTAKTLQKKDLHLAIFTLYIMERACLWEKGSHSRCMNFFNVLLGKIGYKPISHGVIDFAAFAMYDDPYDNEEFRGYDFSDFRRYIEFVMRDIEGQDGRSETY